VLNQEVQIYTDLANNLIEQGKLVEAEVLLRDILLGPYARKTGQTIGHLLSAMAKAYLVQGCFEDAASLARGRVNIYTSTGTNCTSVPLNEARRISAHASSAIEDYDRAIEQYETISAGLKGRPEMFENLFKYDPDWAVALLAVGRGSVAEKRIRAANVHLRNKYGESHYRTLEMVSLGAVQKYLSRDSKEALQQFQKSVPNMLTSINSSGEKTTRDASRGKGLRFILEHYMGLLEEVQAGKVPAPKGFDAASASFQASEAIRNQSVQQSVAASSARRLQATRHSHLWYGIRRMPIWKSRP
jgi:tetratricopeptide (TPR) repeat protein